MIIQYIYIHIKARPSWRMPTVLCMSCRCRQNMSDHLRTTSILGSISQGHRAKPCKTLLMLTGLVRLNVEMLYDVVHVHLSFHRGHHIRHKVQVQLNCKKYRMSRTKCSCVHRWCTQDPYRLWLDKAVVEKNLRLLRVKIWQLGEGMHRTLNMRSMKKMRTRSYKCGIVQLCFTFSCVAVRSSRYTTAIAVRCARSTAFTSPGWRHGRQCCSGCTGCRPVQVQTDANNWYNDCDYYELWSFRCFRSCIHLCFSFSIIYIIQIIYVHILYSSICGS